MLAAAEKFGRPVPAPEWAKMSGIDMILPFPTKVQPHQGDPMVTIKNNSDKTIRLPDGTAVPPGIPKLPAPFDMIVRNGWLDCVAAPCRRCTEKYFAEHPGESLTPETPVWPRFFTGHDGITDMFGCLDLNHSGERLFFNQDTCDYYGLFRTWNRSQWTQGLLAQRWENTSGPDTVGKNNTALVESDGVAYAAYVRYRYQDLPADMGKNSVMTQLNPATAPFFEIRVNGRDVTKQVRRETFRCESSLHSSFVEFELAHQEGVYSGELRRRDHVIVDYPWDSNPFQTPLFDGLLVEPEVQRDDARWIQYRAEAVTLPHTAHKPGTPVTNRWTGLYPDCRNIPKDTGHRTESVGQPNPHGEHEYYWSPELFVSEADKVATPLGLPSVGDLHLHGIASLDGDFTLHGPGGEVQMELLATGDDILVLHLPHRGAADANPVVQPVLWVKRWGEVKIAPGWVNRMGDLAQAFWRAVAQVHRDLPQPVSPKQEAILAFLNERRMILQEFDQQWYARPAIHMDVPHDDERVYPGTEQDHTTWAIVRIKK